MLGGYFRSEMGGEGGGGFLRNYDPEREAILREFEKERIRAEIIAREILKREVVAEVRRELAMERDLMLRKAEGFSMQGMEPGQPMWSDYRASFMPDTRRLGEGNGVSPLSGANPESGGFSSRLPFQRPVESALTANVNVAEKVPEVNNGGKVVILANRSLSLPGTKRKVSSVGASSDLAISSLKKKVKKEWSWSCALCEVSATCERVFNEHLEGKKHKSKQAELQSSKMAAKNSTSAALLDNNNDEVVRNQQAKENEGPDQEEQKLKLKEKFSYRCEHCNVTCLSESVMSVHEKGKKHQAWLQWLNRNGGTVPTPTHGQADEGGPGQEEQQVNNKKKGKLLMLSCELCDVRCDSKMMADHEKGKKHQAWVQRLNKKDGTVTTWLQWLNQLGGAFITTTTTIDEGGSGQGEQKVNNKKTKKLITFRCELCDVSCIGKSMMADHEKGKQHQALLQWLNQNGGIVPSTITQGQAEETDGVNEESGEGKVLKESEEVVLPKEEAQVIDRQ